MEPVIHILIPLICVFAFFFQFAKKRWKAVLMLSLLTLLPDFDMLILKRAFFHNIFFATAVLLIIFFALKKDPGRKKLTLIAAFFLFSHILLDFGGPGVAALYPAYGNLISLKFDFAISPATHKITFESEAGLNNVSMASRDQESPFFTDFSLLLILVVALAFLINHFFRDKKQGRAR